MTTMRPDDVILRKLVLFARGDVSLVTDALRAVQRDNEPIDLKRIMDYITERLPAVRETA